MRWAAVQWRVERVRRPILAGGDEAAGGALPRTDSKHNCTRYNGSLQPAMETLTERLNAVRERIARSATRRAQRDPACILLLAGH